MGLGALAEAGGDVKARRVSSGDKTRLGRERLVELLETRAPFMLDARLDGKALPDAVLLLECLNIPRTGPALRLTEGDPGDGLFEVVPVELGRRDGLRAWVGADAPNTAPLTVHCGRRLVFAWAGVSLRIDDDFYPPPAAPTAVEVEVLPGAVRVLLPRPPLGDDRDARA